MENSEVHRINELIDDAFKNRYKSYNESLNSSSLANELSLKIGYKYGEIVSRLIIEINQFLNSKSENSVEEFLNITEALKEFKANKYHVVANNFLANAYDSIGAYQKGLKYGYEALKLALEVEYKEGEGDTLSTMGLIYMRLCDFNKAIDSFEKSLKIRLENKNIAAAASSFNLLARTNVLMANYNEAKEFYLKSIDIRIKEKHISALPWSYLGLASLYEQQKDYQNAILNYLKAISLNKKSGDKRCILQCNLGLGNIELQLKNYSNSLNYLNEALDISKEINAKPLESKVLYSLAKLEEENGNYEKALNFFKSYNEIHEQLLNKESLNKLKNKEIDFAVEQKRKEAEIYQLRNIELKKAYAELDEKNTEITDSIRYASRIQNAVLPNIELLNNYFSESFLLFLPKDIVSGDFYWMKEYGDELIFMAADCTGHGVPGALMTIMGTAFLDEITVSADLTANEILNRLRKKIVQKLEQPNSETEQKDGMDIALLKFNKKTLDIEYSGAYNPLFLIRNEELEVIKADRMPVGKYYLSDKDFSNHKLKLQKGDQLVIFSDGYIDQFGGENQRKFMVKNFKSLLMSIKGLPLEEQKEILNENIINWRGETPQIDDIIVLSVKV